ncbi:ABC transporter substrate-binding protein [Nocardia sp. NPDC050710]|uniref:ABC transporter substrate-binding protein n=1 Tax=Nocardia sp. NPDC050710 TaxID=3157220 RepID=UPI00340C36DE
MRSLRAAMITVLAVVLALGSAGCTNPTRDSRSDGGPVTVTHVFGATTVTGTPKNIVALGDQWVDASLALGVTPIGRLGSLPGDPPPWTPNSLAAAKPLEATADLAPQIAALHPDLILLDRLPTDRKTYDDLAAVAPTVPRAADAGWRAQMTVLGKLLRKTDEADRIIADFDTRLTDTVRANPGLTGKTYAATWLASDAQLFVLTRPSVAASELFTRLGLRIPDGLAARSDTEGNLVLAPDRLGDLTADLLLAGHSPGLDEKYRLLPGYADLPAARKDAVAFLTTDEIAAVEQPTVLSARYLLDKLTPALTGAAR